MRLKLKIKRIKELFAYGFSALKQDGFLPTFKRGLGFFKRRFGAKKGRFLPPKKTLEMQKNTDFTNWPTISICTPLYNTQPKHLKQFIDSVLAQTCPNWQLCLVNASDDTNTQVADIVLSYNDERIICEKIDNEGISENTNAAATFASGDYIGLADHDDVLAPQAVFMVLQTAMQTKAKFIYSDEALFTNDIKRAHVAHFKPDYAEDYLRSCNYICHFSAIKRELFEELGGFDATFDGSQDHDLFLRICEQTTPVHIPRVLYYWRVHENSTSGGTGAKPYVIEAGKKAVSEHLRRTGKNANVTDGLFAGTYKVEYELEEQPLVSIIIPNKDHVEDLSKAINSVLEKTTYENYEIIIAENNSSEKTTFDYYNELEKKHDNIHIVYYEGGFNFSAINNFARKKANGELLLLLNNDVEIINVEWLLEMVSLCVQDGVGIVGAKLLYPDETLQHAGIITGLGGFAGHSHKYAKNGGSGYMFRVASVQNFSAVTAACLLVKAKVYDELCGLDEKFEVAFNDVDFCLRARQKNYRVLYTPYAQLLHYESKSRGLDEKDAQKKARFDKERALLKERFGDKLTKDEFYNINLTLDSEDFAESAALPKWDI